MEIFLRIKGFEDYSIGNLGTVVSKKYNVSKILKNRIDKSGYNKVCLQQNGKIKYYLVHRLVASYFLSNPKNKKQVNHINGIKSDNRLCNLEWSSASENMVHSYNVLGRNKKRTPVIRIDKYNNNKIYKSIKEASIKNNVLPSSISNCLNGNSKTSGGYRWKHHKENG